MGPPPEFTGKNMTKICLIRFHGLYSYLVFGWFSWKNASISYETEKGKFEFILFCGGSALFLTTTAMSNVASINKRRMVGNGNSGTT
jgi:hypothetical protein